MSKPKKGPKGLRSRRPPTFFVWFNGRRWRVTPLASPPRGPVPRHVMIAMSEDGRSALRFEPELHPEALSDHFEESFAIALASFAGAASVAYAGGRDPASARMIVETNVEALVRGALGEFGPESRRRPAGPIEPGYAMMSLAHHSARDMLRDRAEALGPFTEEEADRLEAIAGEVIASQLRVMGAYDIRRTDCESSRSR